MIRIIKDRPYAQCISCCGTNDVKIISFGDEHSTSSIKLCKECRKELLNLLEVEKTDKLKRENESLKADNDSLKERILDLEACR